MQRPELHELELRGFRREGTSDRSHALAEWSAFPVRSWVLVSRKVKIDKYIFIISIIYTNIIIKYYSNYTLSLLQV